jgi:hypothetical protein
MTKILMVQGGLAGRPEVFDVAICAWSECFSKKHLSDMSGKAFV